ncbi:MAG: GTP-binding protein [Stenotrophomonas sp.]
MQEHKVVVLGPMGAGKSTLVQTLAQGTAIVTEARNTDPAAAKEFTTVALDSADIRLPGGDRLRLYGTPGQARFAFLWPILLKGARGAIVLVDASAGDAHDDALHHLQAIHRCNPTLPLVIGITRCDATSAFMRDTCDAWLQRHAPTLPAIPLDPRSPRQVITLMDVLMSQIECQALVHADE